MKKVVGIILIASPLWFIFVLLIPAVTTALLRGYSFSLIMNPVYRLASFFYFWEIPASNRGFVDRVILYSDLGWWMRLGLWAVILLFVFYGYRLLKGSLAVT